MTYNVFSGTLNPTQSINQASKQTPGVVAGHTYRHYINTAVRLNIGTPSDENGGLHVNGGRFTMTEMRVFTRVRNNDRLNVYKIKRQRIREYGSNDVIQ